MATRLPPLNALRAFEVAARHGGFTLAARELHVTPAAVSHQIKSLESHLDVELFHRLPRGLEITEAGRKLLPQLTRGFDHFARAVDGLSPGGLAGPLTISTAPSFATLWLGAAPGQLPARLPGCRGLSAGEGGAAGSQPW